MWGVCGGWGLGGTRGLGLTLVRILKCQNHLCSNTSMLSAGFQAKKLSPAQVPPCPAYSPRTAWNSSTFF